MAFTRHAASPLPAGRGVDQARAAQAVAQLAARHAPVVCNGLRLENLQGFLALTPTGCEAAVLDLAAAVVEATMCCARP